MKNRAVGTKCGAGWGASARLHTFGNAAPGILCALALAAALFLPWTAAATPLDDYVAAPDSSYAWSRVATYDRGTYTEHILSMYSQNWLTPDLINVTRWHHYIVVIVPDQLDHTTAMLTINGGNIYSGPPTSGSGLAVQIANTTHSVVAELKQIPNEPMTFTGYRQETEDGLIAYGWKQFLLGGDPKWLMRLPMTKAAVRAMDTVTAFMATPEAGQKVVDKYVVMGASKRGWTTWTTAAVDSRVVACAPLVIDVLNMERSMLHHYDAYGFWAESVNDYIENGIMDCFGTPQMASLISIVEPFAYRDRLTMPKLIMNGSQDQFFLPDSSQFYFDRLKGEKRLLYVPNAGHDLEDDYGVVREEARQGIISWYAAILNNVPRPEITWYKRANGTLVIDTHGNTPQQATLWVATNPNERIFIKDMYGSMYQGSTLVPEAPGLYYASAPVPEQGWRAFYATFWFDNPVTSEAFVFSTEISVVPDVLPYGPQRSLGEPVELLDDAFYTEGRTLPDPYRWPMQPSVSNDGKRVAFWGVRFPSQETGLFVVTVGRPDSWKRLCPDLGPGSMKPIVWSPDDSLIMVGQQRLAISADGTAGAFEPHTICGWAADALDATDRETDNWVLAKALSNLVMLPILPSGLEDLSRSPVFITDFSDMAGVSIATASIAADGSVVAFDNVIDGAPSSGDVYSLRNVAALLSAPPRPSGVVSSLAPTTLEDDNLSAIRGEDSGNYSHRPSVSDDGTVVYYTEDWLDVYGANNDPFAALNSDFDVMASYSDGTEAVIRLETAGSQGFADIVRGGARAVYTEPVFSDSRIRLRIAPVTVGTKKRVGNMPVLNRPQDFPSMDVFESDGSATVRVPVGSSIAFAGEDHVVTIETPALPVAQSSFPAGVVAMPFVRTLGPAGMTFTGNATFTLKYTPGEMRMLDEDALRVYRLDEATNVFQAQDPAVLAHDTVNNTFTVHLEGAGTFAIGGGIVDRDNDGMGDLWEVEHGLNPAVNDAAEDADGDVLNNLGEYTAGTDPQSPDTDGDGLSDGAETQDLDPATEGIQNPFNAFEPDTTGNNGVAGADGRADGANDWDGDGVSNADEWRDGTNPADPQSVTAQVPLAYLLGAPTRVVTGQADHFLAHLRWSHAPDDSTYKLAYLDRTNSTYYTVPADGSAAPSAIPFGPTSVGAYFGVFWDYAWAYGDTSWWRSETGGQIGNPDVPSLLEDCLNGSGTAQSYFDGLGTAYFPDVSPVGTLGKRYMMYTRYLATGDWDLNLAAVPFGAHGTLASNAPHIALTNFPTQDEVPGGPNWVPAAARWSRDAQSVAYMHVLGDEMMPESETIYVLHDTLPILNGQMTPPVDRTDPRLVEIDSGNVWYPNFTPDGRAVFYSKNLGAPSTGALVASEPYDKTDFDIAYSASAGGGVYTFAKAGDQIFAVVSPDGTKIAYADNSSGTWDIYVAELIPAHDADHDGLSDEEESTLGTNPNNSDTDGDGLTDGEEVHTYGTLPLVADTDGDGLTDGDEVRDLDLGVAGVQNPFNPTVADSTGNNGNVSPDGVPDGENDWDGDGQTNAFEVEHGSNPLDADATYDADEDGMLWSTFLGSSYEDDPGTVEVDPSGCVYVAGVTYGIDFPTTAGAFKTSTSQPMQGFITKLDPTGRHLIYSTFMGGTNADAISDLSVDSRGAVTFLGASMSSDFPRVGLSYSGYHGGTDAILGRLSPDGSLLEFSTYFGGADDEYKRYGHGLAVGADGSLYITGYTASPDLPTTPGAHRTSLAGNTDAFVAKLSPRGERLLFSTYLGGALEDSGLSVAVADGGGAYVTGYTYSTDFPVTAGAADTVNDAGDAFVAQVGAAGNLVLSTFLGGAGFDRGCAIVRDGADGLWVTGSTASADFPATAGAAQEALWGTKDSFVANLSTADGSVRRATLLGGSSTEDAYHLECAPDGSVWVSGATSSVDFPTTTGAYDRTANGGRDAFVAQLTADLTRIEYGTYLGGSGDEGNPVFALDGRGDVLVAGSTASTNFPVTPAVFDESFNGGENDAFVTRLHVMYGGSDLDGDGMPDDWESAHGLDPAVNDAAGDPDGDGLSNLAEYTNGSDPQVTDSDADGLSDGVEVNQYGSDPTQTDTDGDGLSDMDEVRDLDPATPGIQNPFNPAQADSTGNGGAAGADGIADGRNDYDGDGVSNADELNGGTNPYDPSDGHATGPRYYGLGEPMLLVQGEPGRFFAHLKWSHEVHAPSGDYRLGFTDNMQRSYVVPANGSAAAVQVSDQVAPLSIYEPQLWDFTWAYGGESWWRMCDVADPFTPNVPAFYEFRLADGANLRTYQEGTGCAYSPDFSDGANRYMAYGRVVASQGLVDNNVFYVPVRDPGDTPVGPAQKLTNLPWQTTPAPVGIRWSRDARSLAYESGLDIKVIQDTLPVLRGQMTPVSDPADPRFVTIATGAVSFPSFLADGQTLFFTKDLTDGNQGDPNASVEYSLADFDIAYVPASGGTPETISLPGDQIYASMAPTGKRIAYADNNSGTWNVYVANLAVFKPVAGAVAGPGEGGTPIDGVNDLVVSPAVDATDDSGAVVSLPEGSIVDFPVDVPQRIGISAPLAAPTPEQLPLGVTALPVIRDFGPDGTHFYPAALVTFTYTDADVAGLDETALRLFRFNETTGLYDDEVLPSDIVERDPANNRIVFQVAHFSRYALGGAPAGTNRPPFVEPIGNQTVAEGKTLFVAVQASDPDGDTLTLSASGLPTGAIFTDNGDGTGVVVWVPDFGTVGEYAGLTITATDSGTPSYSDAAVFSVTVTNGNRPPALVPIEDQFVTEGQVLDIPISAPDPDGDTVVLTVWGLPTFASFVDNGDGTGVIHVAPSITEGGWIVPISVEATEVTPDGLISTDDFVLTVRTANKPPVFGNQSDATMAEGETLVIPVQASDLDGDYVTLTPTAIPPGATFVQLNDGYGELTYHADSNASEGSPYTVTFEASDGQAAVSRTFHITVTDVNRAPELAPVGNIDVSEGEVKVITVVASDPDGNPLALSISWLPSFATFVDNGDGTATLRLAPDFNDAEMYNGIVITATDNGSPALSDSETVTLTINNVNQAPVLDPVGPQAVAEGAALTFTVSASDPDHDNLTLGAGPLPEGATFVDNGDGTGTFAWTPGYDAAAGSPYTVAFEVSDGTLTGTEAVSVTVTNTNRAPQILPIDDKTIAEGDSIEVVVQATDPDGDPVALTAENLPAGSVFADQGDGTGLLRWTTDYDDAGTFPNITFTAEDNGAPVLSATESFNLTVTDTNQAPVLAPVGPKTVGEALPLTFTVTATDMDGNALTLSATPLPAGATFVDNGDGTGTFAWTPGYDAASGSPYTITFEARDAALTATEAVVITVTNTNRAPELAAIGDRSLAEGEVLAINVAASDPDGDGLVLAATGLPAGAVFTDNGDGTGILSWAPSYTDAGTHAGITVIVSDNSEPVYSDSETFTVTVNDTNRAPELAAIGGRSTLEGAALSFTVSATDADGNPVTLTAAPLPSGATFVDNGDGTGTFAWTPGFDAAAASPYSVTFEARDAALSDTETVAIAVTNANRAPELATIGEQTVAEGESLQVPVQASDPDGNGVVLSAANLPAFAAFVDNGDGTGALTLTPGYDAEGTYANVTVTATDNEASPLSDAETFSIVVTNVAHAPNAPLVTGTTPTQDTTPTWTWTSGGGNGAGVFRYQIDGEGGLWTETSSTSYTPATALAAGSHTLYVQERSALDTTGWSVSGSFAIVVEAPLGAGQLWGCTFGAHSEIFRVDVASGAVTAYHDFGGLNFADVAIDPTETTLYALHLGTRYNKLSQIDAATWAIRQTWTLPAGVSLNALSWKTGSTDTLYGIQEDGINSSLLYEITIGTSSVAVKSLGAIPVGSSDGDVAEDAYTGAWVAPFMPGDVSSLWFVDVLAPANSVEGAVLGSHTGGSGRVAVDALEFDDSGILWGASSATNAAHNYGTRQLYRIDASGATANIQAGWDLTANLQGEGISGLACSKSIVSNGSFETGTNPGSTLVVPAGSTAIGDWTVLPNGVTYVGTYAKAATGARSVKLTTQSSGAIAQTLQTVPGRSYLLTFLMAGDPYSQTTKQRVKDLAVTLGDSTRNFRFNVAGRSVTNMGWETRSWRFTATSAETVLAFASKSAAPYGPMVDNVAVVPVQGEVLWGVTNGTGDGGFGTGGQIFTFDTATGVAEVMASYASPLQAFGDIAVRDNGEIYVTYRDSSVGFDKFAKVNPETWAFDWVVDLGGATPDANGIGQVNALEFIDGKLLGVTAGATANLLQFRVSATGATVRKIGSLGSNSEGDLDQNGAGAIYFTDRSSTVSILEKVVLGTSITKTGSALNAGSVGGLAFDRYGVLWAARSTEQILYNVEMSYPYLAPSFNLGAYLGGSIEGLSSPGFYDPSVKIANAGFESGNNPGSSLKLAARSTALTNWIIGGGGITYIGTLYGAAEGARCVKLTQTKAGYIEQTFDTDPGVTYDVTFMMAGDPYQSLTASQRVKVLEVSVREGTTAKAAQQFSFDVTGHTAASMGWEARTMRFTATSGRTTLRFTSITSSAYGPCVDGVQIQTVP